MPASTAVVNKGRDILTNRIIGSGTEPKYVAMGTGTTAVALTDTALGGEVESRTTGTSSRTTTSTTNDTYQVTGTVTATTSRTIGEAGLFDQSALGGNMFVRGVLASTISLASGDSIAFTFTVQVTSAVV
jgi:hypothetical protein